MRALWNTPLGGPWLQLFSAALFAHQNAEKKNIPSRGKNNCTDLDIIHKFTLSNAELHIITLLPNSIKNVNKPTWVQSLDSTHLTRK
jgi:hypothetical protein